MQENLRVDQGAKTIPPSIIDRANEPQPVRMQTTGVVPSVQSGSANFGVNKQSKMGLYLWLFGGIAFLLIVAGVVYFLVLPTLN